MLRLIGQHTRYTVKAAAGFLAGDANLYRYVGNSPLTFIDPLGLAASVSYGTFVQRARAVANGMASAAIGYVCGYTEAHYTNSAYPNQGYTDPHQRAVEEMVTGFVLGYAVEGVSDFQRHRLLIGIGLVIGSIRDAPDLVVLGVRTTCIMVELTSLGEKGRFLGDDSGAIGSRGAELRPYGGPGGGHHVLAKSGFRGAPGYNLNEALAIPNAELARLGVEHPRVTGAQPQLYRAFSQTGKPLTWKAIKTIETQALVRGGMDAKHAAATVQKAIQALKDAGVSGPTRIPWGG